MTPNNKKRILVLGSGMVSRPGIHYLLKTPGLFVTVASNELPVAEKLVQGFKNSQAVFIDVQKGNDLEKLITHHDIIVSLLPWTFHVQVAGLCLKHHKHMATASYVSEGMKKLAKDIEAQNLLFINEIGVDPGIDHMSTMKVIDEITTEGGKILHYYSFCGGLPAPDNNDNPFGYKFSWSPRGVILASRNSARFLENGQEINIDGKDLFLHFRIENIEGLGTFEVYPNRDSIPYKELYGLKDAQTIMRGTYRYPGWCKTLKKIVDIGLIDDTPREHLVNITYREMMEKLTATTPGQDVITQTAQKLGLTPDDDVIKRFQWLGLFSTDPIPPYNNHLDILSQRMQEKLSFKPGEKDLLLMQHKFIIENKDKSRDIITSTIIDFGIPGGDTSMARTVSLPLAIAVRLMAENRIPLTGIQIANRKEIYQPVLKELAQMDIKPTEKREHIQT